MERATFIAVGENIHCTRIYKVGGAFVDADSKSITYQEGGQRRRLPIPARFTESSDWKNGKVKHAAVAMWQGTRGDEAGRRAGREYLQHMVRNQESHGASFLDLNVDEFSTDVGERRELVEWAAAVVQEVSSVPLSIDSSNVEILQAGLSACDPAKGKPMVNSVSLERQQAVGIAAEKGAVVIAAATGETSMPAGQEERLANLERLVVMLGENGLGRGDIYLDPLVFPVSVDPGNGKMILEVIAKLRERYGEEIHFAPGLSNISYGMPNRKLINQVFTYLCRERGLDGGIVDPSQINDEVLQSIDPEAESFELARAFLLGEDQFGMAYIAAVRGGRI